MKIYFSFINVKGKSYPTIKIRDYNLKSNCNHRKQGEIRFTGSSAIEYLCDDLIKSKNYNDSLIYKLDLSKKLNFLTYSEIDDIPTLTYDPGKR